MNADTTCLTVEQSDLRLLDPSLADTLRNANESLKELSDPMTLSRASWKSAEPTQISLPVEGREPVVDRLEKQFDQLLDLLAADQVLEDRQLRPNPVERDESVFDAPTDASCIESAQLELSIVMPCLDEAETVGNCVLKAQYALDKLGISGEVIVADNGSQDDSVEIAESLGARVIHVTRRGYGAALMAGIEAARGRFIIMGDADDSYDFTVVPKFYQKLCEGADLVQGCRLPGGGGRVMPGAMPKLHQWGNPWLTWMVRKMFRAPINDVYCGMRAFRKDFYQRLDQRCTGMEFATEMIIKSTLFGARISEIPITLYRDGRTLHRPHLRTFRDGWRTLRFFLLQSPRWTFLVPGAAIGAVGLIGAMFALLNVNLAGAIFDAHTLLVSTLAILVSAQLVSCAVLAKTFASGEGLLPRDNRLEKLSHVFTLERCLAASGLLIAGGVATVCWQAISWASAGFGALDYSSTMKCLIPAIGAVALGVQAAASSFLLSVLRMARR